MTRPYSLDLRDPVARFVVAGGTTREAAERFAVSVTAAGRWARRLRETGSAAALPMGGTRRAVLAGERDWLLAQIKGCSPTSCLALTAGWLGFVTT